MFNKFLKIKKQIYKKIFLAEPEVLNFHFDPDIHSSKLNKMHQYIQNIINSNQLESLQLDYCLDYQIQQQSKSVCAKIVRHSDTVVQCLNCRMDSSCIICLECFENGNHQGHKYKIKKNCSGCCDCGDREAWKQQGFCKNHTGQIKKITIQSQKQESFNQIWQHLFYWYFCIKNKQSKQIFGIKLSNYLKSLITSNMYYNTLCTNLFSSKFQKHLFQFHEERFYTQNVLENIFEYSTNQSVDRLFTDCFIGMFANYDFKKIILKTYFVKYQNVLLGQKSFSDLGCQLLTSYELVSEFLRNNPMLLKHKFQVNFIKTQQKKFYRYVIDLKYILKLQGDAPLLYCKILLENFDNFYCINSYQKEVESNWQSSYQDSFYLDRFYLELELLEFVFLIGKIIKHQKQFLQQTILKLIDYLSLKTIRNVCYFLLHRLLSVLIFTYIESKVQNLYSNSKSQTLKKILDKLQKNLEIFQPFFKCFSFYLGLKTNPKKRQLFRQFYLYYAEHYRQAFNTDVFMIILYNSLQRSQSISILSKFFDYDNSSKLKMIILEPNKNMKQYQQQDLIEVVNSVINSVSFSLQICISRSEMISFAYCIDQQMILYRQQIKQLLTLLLSTYSNVTVEVLQGFKKIFLHRSMNIDNELKEISKYDKNSKKYIINNKSECQLIMHYAPSKQSFSNFINQHETKIKSLQLKYNLQSFARKIFAKIFQEKIILDLVKFIQMISLNDSIRVKESLDNLYIELIKILIISKNVQNGKVSNILDQLFFTNESFRNRIKKQILLLLPQNLHIKDNLVVVNLETKNQGDEIKKKISIKQLQKKKIQEIKLKQKKFTDSLAKKIISQESRTEQQQLCVVCKSKQQNKICVYLAHASFSNLYKYVQIEALQKLIQKSSGKRQIFLQMMIDYKRKNNSNKLIITSCHHLIHYECYINYTKIHKGPESCPLCKKFTNIFIPIIESMDKLQVQLTQNKIKIIIAFFNILEKLSQTDTKIKQQSKKHKRFLPLLIKSFLEVLIFNGMVNTQFFIKKLLKTYQIILNLLRQFLTLFPKQRFDKQQKQIYKQIQYTNFFNQQSYDHQLTMYLREYVMNSFQLEIFNKLMSHIGITQMQEQKKNSYYIRNYTSNHAKNLIFSKRSALLESLFNKDLTTLQNFESILKKNQQIQGKQVQKQLNFVLDVKSFKLVQLPTRYYPLSKFRGKCPNCNKLGNSKCLCLICNWKGCKDCESENLFKHSSLQHASNTIFINIQTTQLIFSGSNSFWKGEPIYINEFGTKFNIFKQWQDFEIDYNEVMKAQKLINEYELSSYILYQQIKFGKKYLSHVF